MPEEQKHTAKTVDTQKEIVVSDEGGSKQDINTDKKYELPTSETEGRGPKYVQDAIGVEEPQPKTVRPSLRSLAAQTNQGKMRVKDHLIKVMADQLIELAHNNVWDGYESLEASLSPTGSDGNYDWDRNTLILYLKGEEPQHYAAAMKSIEDIPKTNPLNVKIVRKLDEDSLLIEWGPPPFAEAVGFQIFLNGHFLYWIHSKNRNKAMLHPFNLKSLLEIAVSPIDAKGKVLHRSIIVYKPS